MQRHLVIAALLGGALAACPPVSALAKPVTRGPFVFDCMGEAPGTITATFLGAKAARARLTYKGETVIAKQAVSADGGLYRGKDVEFWNKGDDAVVEWRGDKLKCAIDK